MLFNLIEKTAGPWHGMVLRSEEMTAEEAQQRNAKMSGLVIAWEPHRPESESPQLELHKTRRSLRVT